MSQYRHSVRIAFGYDYAGYLQWKFAKRTLGYRLLPKKVQPALAESVTGPQQADPARRETNDRGRRRWYGEQAFRMRIGKDELTCC